jgi:hypothetical protein
MWALWGIRAARAVEHPFLSQAALGCLVLILIVLVSGFIKKEKSVN